MEIIRHLLLLLFLSKLNNFINGEEEYCPKSCECDSFEYLNRANCRGHKLISASLEISKYVQILDLDQNEITILDNECFKNQIHMTNLSIAHNSINTIYLNAFSTLKKLKSIDLSYNRLEYINEKIFEYNYQLVEVNLSGNKFMSLPNQPLFISSSIQNLFLQNAQIVYIYPKLFSQMPSLKHLDLSENLMITLTTEPLNFLNNLLTLNIENNRWICDKNIENVIKLLKNRQIEVKLNMCQFELRKNGANMFEKIIVDPNLNIETNNKEDKTQIIIQSVWKRINEADNEIETCSKNNILHVCNLYKVCLTNLTILSQAVENSQNDLKQLNTKNGVFRLIEDTHLTFFLGMCIGASIVFVIIACTLCVTKVCNSKNEKFDEINDLVSANTEFQYVHSERPSPHSNQSMALSERAPPIPARIPRRRRRRPPPAPPLNRSISSPARTAPSGTVNDFASFISRLFERPARHRYYRAFNENTAHLIRRLSRSSLVNNRLSQHFLNETNRNRNERNPIINNNNQEISTEQQPLNRSGNDNENIIQDDMLFVQLPDENETSNSRFLNNRRMSLEEYRGPDIPRPETPPPSYIDVVSN